MNQFKGLYVPVDYAPYHNRNSYCNESDQTNKCHGIGCENCLFQFSFNFTEITEFTEWLNYNFLIKNRTKKLERILNEPI